MAAEVKTAQDLRNIHERLKNDMIRFEAYLDQRLCQLAKAYPDAVLTKVKSTEIKAKSITMAQVALFDIDRKIGFIETIEAYILSQQKYVQGKLFN